MVDPNQLSAPLTQYANDHAALSAAPPPQNGAQFLSMISPYLTAHQMELIRAALTVPVNPSGNLLQPQAAVQTAQAPAAAAAAKPAPTPQQQAMGTLGKEGFNPVQATNMTNDFGAATLNKGFAAGSTLSPTAPKADASTQSFLDKQPGNTAK